MLTATNHISAKQVWLSYQVIKGRQLKLGLSFAKYAEHEKIFALFEKQNFLSVEAAGTTDNAGIVDVSLLNDEERFYLFVRVLALCYDAVSFCFPPEFTGVMTSIAAVLYIDEDELSQIIEFFICNKPYSDQVDSVYIGPENSDPLLKAKAVNIHFRNKEDNKVIHLKYFSKPKAFLSKTYYFAKIYSSFEEEVRFDELNLVTEKYPLGALPFAFLKHEIETFQPLQLVEAEASEHRPQIILDPLKCTVVISGSSAPLSVSGYFGPVLDWMHTFDKLGPDHLEISIALQYFNTYTSKFLIYFVSLSHLMGIHEKKIDLFWFYDQDDEDSKDFGQYLHSRFSNKIKFHLIENNNSVQP